VVLVIADADRHMLVPTSRILIDAPISTAQSLRLGTLTMVHTLVPENESSSLLASLCPVFIVDRLDPVLWSWFVNVSLHDFYAEAGASTLSAFACARGRAN
jgi:hypothetical protein